MQTKNAILLWVLLFLLFVLGIFWDHRFFQSSRNFQYISTQSEQVKSEHDGLELHHISHVPIDHIIFHINDTNLAIPALGNSLASPTFSELQEPTHPDDLPSFSDSFGQDSILRYARYPLDWERLRRDLWSYQIDFILIDQEGKLTITQDSPDYYHELFNYYQHPNRNTRKILTFLKALSDENLPDALALLQDDYTLIPFKGILEQCYQPTYRIEWNGILIEGICIQGMAGPDDVKMKLFIAGQHLYLYHLQAEQQTPIPEWGAIWNYFSNL